MFRARNDAGPKHYSLTWSQESCLLHNRPLIVDNRDATFNILVSFRDDTLEGVLEIVSQRVPTESRLYTNQLAIGQRLVHTAPVIAIVGRTERVCGIQEHPRLSDRSGNRRWCGRHRISDCRWSSPDGAPAMSSLP